MTDWIHEGEAAIAADPARIADLFPAAGREVGRGAVRPDDDPQGYRHGTLDDLARERFVVALVRALPADRAAAELRELHRYGDDAERRGVLRGLGAAEEAGGIGAVGASDPTGGDPLVDAGVNLVLDALRANDPRLVAAALGPFAARHLDQHAWRHGVLKAVFMDLPLDVVAGLDDRADVELARMAAGLIAERRAACRTVTDDMTRLATAPAPAAAPAPTDVTAAGDPAGPHQED
ncbi:EboA domain-containing protein [Agromyces sp. MMS24-JH15]|uniref:EboA domain-containing protein n=1 Tax=Agromyces sp. MMS24-JH15 TaxID=3243765 RepID=UPI003749C9DE